MPCCATFSAVTTNWPPRCAASRRPLESPGLVGGRSAAGLSEKTGKPFSPPAISTADDRARQSPPPQRGRLADPPAEAGLDGVVLEGDAVRLVKPVPVDKLPGFAEGDVSVQDAGAQLAADWLEVADGMRVLDACAAPGQNPPSAGARPTGSDRGG